MKKSSIVYLLSLFVLFACGTNKKSFKNNPTKASHAAPETTAAEVVDSLETPKERPVYRASRTVLTDLIHTKLELKPDWSKAYMYGIASITAKPHFYSTDSLILDAKGMTINSVKLGDKALTYTYQNDVLKINLDKSYSRKEQYTVVIDYIAKPNERETGGSAAITSAKGLYFINHDGSDPNKMPQIWTQGETQSSSVWFPTIDSPNMKTSQEIFITVDDKYVTLSNGQLVNSKQNGDGTRTDHWKQELPHAPYLFMLGIGEFKIVKDSYTKANGSKIAVNYYVEPEWEDYADDIFGKTPEMIGFFSKKLGVEYPWDKYHQIVVRDYVSGAMENTGAVVFGDFVYRTDREMLDNNSESIVAHELFHHWFGDLVTAESWSNLPLNESFANYSQYLWDEHEYGENEADFNANSETMGYMQQAKMQGYHDLIWYDYNQREQMFDGHSYNKGGRILHMLRNYVGDDAFFTALNKYLTNNQFKAAEYNHLRLAFENVTGEDLNWFFNQWFLASGHPSLKITQKIEGNEVVLNIHQTQNLNEFPIFKLPTQVAVVDSKGKTIHNIVIDAVENEFRFPFSGALITVIPDYQEALLAEVEEDKPQSQFIAQYYHSNEWRTKNRALMFGTKDYDSTKAQQLILDALTDSFWALRVEAISKAGLLTEANKQKARTIIKDLASNDPVSAVRAKALGFINSSTTPGAKELYIHALSDSSYTVITAALNYLAKLDPETAMISAADLEKEKSSSLIVGIGSLYAKHGGEEKITYFKNNLTNGSLSGFSELGLMNLMSQFIIKQNITQLDNSYETYQYLAESGGMYTKMFIGQNMKYILKNIDNRIDEKNNELKTAEEANSTLDVTKIKAAIANLLVVKSKYETLLAK